MKPLFRLLLGAALALGLAAAARAQSLGVSAVTVDNATPKPGDTVTFTITIINNDATTGYTGGGNVDLALTLSNQVTGQSIALPVSTVVLANLAASATVDVKISKTIPTVTSQAGACKVTVAMSGTNANASFTSTGALLTITGKPDLAITSLTYPAGTAYKGGDVIPMQLTWTNFSNSGANNVPYVPSKNSDSSKFRIEIILSSNPTFGDGDDFLLAYFDVSGVQNADSVDRTINWTQLLPGNFAGSYYVMAKIDTLGGVAETTDNDLSVNGNNTWFDDTNAARINILPTNFPTDYWASTGGNGYSDNPALSSDGRYVTFASDSTNLTGTGLADTNNVRDIFLYDNQTSTVRRINLSQQGAQANGASNNPAISADGRYVAFASEATNLVVGDTNGFSDIYVVDTLTGTISLASVTTAGVQANGSNFKPSISADGRYVVFESSATNLVSPATTFGVTHIYLRDRTSGTTVLVDQSTGGAVANGSSLEAAISADGTAVAFASDATNLAGGDGNGVRDIFVRSITAATTIRVSVSTAGTEGNSASHAPSISSTGRFIAFGSTASNLVAGDTNAVSDIFVYDRDVSASGTFDTPGNSATHRVSVSTAGAEATDPSGAGFRLGSVNPSISSDGRYVTFASLANNLAVGDSGGQTQTLTVDNAGTGYATVPTVTLTGGGGTGATAVATVSGGFVTSVTITNPGSGYTSAPTVGFTGGGGSGAAAAAYANPNGYVTGPDANNAVDVFVADRDVSASGTFDTPGNIATSMVSVNRFGYQTQQLLGIPSSAASDIYPVISADGRWVALPSDAEGTSGLVHGANNRTSPDNNTYRDVYLHDRRTNALPGASEIPLVTVAAQNPVLVNTDVAVTASATTAISGGVISSVAFYVNGTLLSTSTQFPYTATWTPHAVGTFTLSALATDNFGNIGVSTNVTVTVNAAPGVSITSPVTNSSYVIGATPTITATATATTPGATITSVQFYANGAAVGAADTTAPYSVVWTPASTGTYSLTAVATDSIGTQATSSAVLVNVTNGAVTPSGITLDTPASGSLSVNVPTAVNATATPVAGASVTSVEFFANNVSLGTDNTYPYAVSWTPAALGTYTVVAVLIDSNGTQTTSAAHTVTVTAPAAPAVSITSPAANVVVGVTQTLAATATSTGGTVTQVQYAVNGVVLGAVTQYPYTLAWTPVTAGTYVITAVATDNYGTQTTTTSTVTVGTVVGTAPTVSFTAPAAAANLAVNSANSLTVSASANNAGATIAGVQFYVNGAPLATVTVFPYTTVWTPLATGSYTLTAVAFDTLGNQNTATRSVTVTGGTPPTVTTSSPTTGAAFAVGNTISFSAQVALGSGLINNFKWYVNGLVVHEDLVTPSGQAGGAPPFFNYQWSPAAAGTYVITGVATDSSGNVATSAPVTVTVSAVAAPTVSITSPSGGSTLPVNSTQTITATASSAAGALSSVEFFANGRSIGVDSQFPYSVAWTPTGAGAYTLTAVATDDLGSQTTSAPVAVTVAAGSPSLPYVYLTSTPTGTNIAVDTPVVISANAGDPDGTVTGVEFYVNGQIVGSSTTVPYHTVWVPAAAGPSFITAVVTDDAGHRVTSAAATLTAVATVGSAPLAGLSFNNPAIDVPAPGTTPAAIDPFVPVDVQSGSKLIVTALGADSDGTIASVQFFANGTLIATVGASPYYTIYSLGLSDVTLIALVTDNSGNSAYSSPIYVHSLATVGNDTHAVTLVSPVDAATYVEGGQIIFSATHNYGTVNPPKIDFYVNGHPFATTTSAPYQTLLGITQAGTYDIHAVVRSGTSTTVSSVAHITVTSNTAPTVSLTSPGTGTQYTVGTPLTLTAAASDSDGTIQSVQFLLNGSLLSTAKTAPFTAAWSPGSPGIYTIHALAIDDAGNQTLSAPIVVTIVGNTPPIVAVTSPNAGATIVAGTLYNLAATAADSDGTVASVTFLANGSLIGTATSAPFAVSWRPTVAGSYNLTALATDNLGSQAVSSSVAVTVTAASAPTVSLTSPSAGPLTINVPQTIRANANSTSGAITSVQFTVNGLNFGVPDTVYPYEISWTPTAPGIYDLRAIATDSSGSITTSAATTVSVSSGLPPTGVVLTAPSSPVQANVAQSLSATATAVTGSIASVQFFVTTGGVTSAISTDTAFPYTATWTPAAPGSYTLTAVATDTVGNQTTSNSVALTANTGAVPVVTIVNPNTGGTYVASKTILFDATASDPDGTITQVEFLANNVVVATDTNSPYFTNWSPASPGSYTLIARATDNAGNVTDSAPVTITVTQNTPAVINLLSPANATHFTAGTTVVFFATASDANGTINHVTFLANGDVIGSDVTTAPYSTIWTPTIPGTYTVLAIAVDNDQNASTSPTRTVVIDPVVGQLPTVSIVSPVNGAANITTASTVPLVARPYDPDGFPVSVAFYDNGVQIGTAIAVPQIFNWQPTVPGSHRLVAVVTDNSGNNVSSAPVDVTVVAATSTPPNITLNDPGTQVAGTAVTLSATATDSDGTVASVQFLVNEVALSTDSTTPFTAVWTPSQAGPYRLTAIATDSSGNQTVSAAVSVIVSAAVAPTVSITSPAAGALPINIPQTIRATAASTTGSIASVEFTINGISFGTDTTYPYEASWTPSAPGTYVLRAIATDNLGTTTTSASRTVTVAAQTLPTIAILNPVDNASVTVNSLQTIVADVGPGTYAISSVQFLVNGSSIATVTSYPYATTWTPTNLGNYVLTAVVADVQGNHVTSSPVSVSVPAMALSVISNNGLTTVTQGSDVILRADPTPPSQGVIITQVQFMQDAHNLGSPVTAAPYTLVYHPTSGTSHAITAVVTRSDNSSVQSSVLTINVVPPVVAPVSGPVISVAITNPQDQAKLAIPASVSPIGVSVNAASTTGGFVNKVELYVDGSLFGSATAYPYVFNWAPASAGTYHLVALAYDNQGNVVASTTSTTATTTPAATTVDIIAPPVIAITSPLDGGTLPGGSALVGFNASSSNNYPLDVQLYQDDVYVGGATLLAGGTGSITYVPTQKIHYDVNNNPVVELSTLYAVATDSLGLSTQSAVVLNLHVTKGGSGSGTTVGSPPSNVKVIAPVLNTELKVGAPVTIAATAEDTDGNITSVEVRVNNQVVGTLTSYPYYLTWTPTNLGTYKITVKATDNSGNTVTSSEVPVTVTDSGPSGTSVAVTAPANGAVFTAGTPTTLKANATDDVSIANVQFFVNGQPLGTPITSLPYNLSWTPVAAGSYTIIARATDNVGNQATSSTVTVTVNPNASPTVTLTSPQATTVVAGTTLSLAATASDTDGTVTGVKFYANNVLVGSASSAPYTATWTPSASGAYTVLAQATDDSGNVTNSSSVVVTVSANQAPSVAISAPANGNVIRIGTGVTIAATATDIDGTVTSVQIVANGTVLTTLTSTPYTYLWNPTTEGVYRLTAVATDNSGATTTSATVTVMASLVTTANSDTVYSGTYAALGEFGNFTAVNLHGRSATFIGYIPQGQTQSAAKTYYYANLPIDASNSFILRDASNNVLISGTFSDTGVTGSVDNGRITFVGPIITTSSSTPVAAGYYSGSILGQYASVLTGIVGPNGTITLYLQSGTITDSGAGSVDSTGAFTINTRAGNKFTGKADPATGFLSGTLSGAASGSFAASQPSGNTVSDGFLRNISTRGLAGSGNNVLIAGFVVTGDVPKQILVRAIGPSMQGGLTGLLPDPQLQVFSGNTAVPGGANNDWTGLSSTFAQVGAFPLTPGSKDAAVLLTLNPGVYSAQVSDFNGASGLALVELYDVDNQAAFSTQKMVNISTRGQVGAGNNLLIAGFVVNGSSPKRVLVRGVGPAIAQYLPGLTLADPIVRIVRVSDGSTIRENDNWEVGNDPTLVVDAATRTGATPLAAGSKDAAILMTLPPGIYSAQLFGANNGTGIGLIEVYEVP